MHADPGLHQVADLTAFIERRDDGLYTDSRSVALLFGKRHADVLRSIEKLLHSKRTAIARFAKRNFAFCSYDDRGRPMPMYRMTAKGMAQLTMGFTGEDAAELRINFVEAFDELLMRARNEGDALWDRYHAARRDDAVSAQKGTIGSLLMHERRREKPAFEEKLKTIMASLQMKLW